MKKRHLEDAVSDEGMYGSRRQHEYKAEWYGSRIVIAKRFYASSKTFSRCSSVQQLELV